MDDAANSQHTKDLCVFCLHLHDADGTHLCCVSGQQQLSLTCEARGRRWLALCGAGASVCEVGASNCVSVRGGWV